jgi:hypothetical protein
MNRLTEGGIEPRTRGRKLLIIKGEFTMIDEEDCDSTLTEPGILLAGPHVDKSVFILKKSQRYDASTVLSDREMALAKRYAANPCAHSVPACPAETQASSRQNRVCFHASMFHFDLNVPFSSFGGSFRAGAVCA